MKSSLHSVSRRLANHAQRLPSAHKRNLPRHGFHSSARRLVVKPFVLADIGEGIREVQIIQWFVQPGARIEQFDKIVEVASDKAIVEITSRFDGVIKKLHYEVDAMAQVGKALCDIDIQGDINPADEKLITPDTETPQTEKSSTNVLESSQKSPQTPTSEPAPQSQGNGSRKSSHLATPAVRGLLKEHNLDIANIQGTGREGRVLKEDVHNHINSQSAGSKTSSSTDSAQSTYPTSIPTSRGQDTTTPMTPVQAAMFRTMTKSASIPHFLYSDEVDFTELSSLRAKLNTSLSKQTPPTKLSYLPYIIKAVSLSLQKYPLLNATFSQSNGNGNGNGNGTPSILYRSSHNIGIAMDTPQGLLVPVIKNVQDLSILEIAQRLSELQELAASGSLIAKPDLLSGGTITISNIGNIGGLALSPMIVEGQSAILGVGRAREVPRFDEVDRDRVVRRLISTFSWTADHRILDGATVARFAERVADSLREPGAMILETR